MKYIRLEDQNYEDQDYNLLYDVQQEDSVINEFRKI